MGHYSVCAGCVQLIPVQVPSHWMYTHLQGERFDLRCIGLGFANMMEATEEMRLFMEDTWEQAEGKALRNRCLR